MPPVVLSLVESWAVVVALAVVASAGMGRALWLARCTTLVTPLAWGLAGIAAVAGVELAASSRGAPIEQLRYLAATTTLCPVIAILGAKRPQARAWQWIVLSFLVVLWLPALQALVYRSGGESTPHAAWRWLLLAVCAMGVANYLLTRFGVAALLVGAAQLLLLGGAIPGSPLRTSRANVVLGLALVCVAVVVSSLCRRRLAADGAPWNNAWRDFRDRYGAVWTLRLAERMNAEARRRAWPVRVDWFGFQPLPAASADAHSEADRTAAVDRFSVDLELRREVYPLARMLLRRFVSPTWIAARWREEPQAATRSS